MIDKSASTSVLPRTACIIPTYNGRNDLKRLLDSLKPQNYPFDILIVDSSSTDGTYQEAQIGTKKALQIPSCQFNHGGTRQYLVDTSPEYDFYIFMTQDAYLEDSKAIENIMAPFSDPHVGAVCGRQLPHHDANILARHARVYNYPEHSQIKALKDAKSLGLKVAFMSNSFAAYRRSALLDAGGFPKHVIFAEDMYIAAKMLLGGWKISYSGEATCRHSHNYSIADEFRRYFDMGVFHSRETWIRNSFGGAGGEGLRYVLSEINFLVPSNIHLIPASITRNAIKLLAYKIGQFERKLPVWLKEKLGMYKRYWKGPYANSHFHLKDSYKE
ncbi:glycosyltransferase family 2 protein [Pseudomonas sp. PI1]|jgi:rhamnosyltransferase|uniref:glycosyltransferase family 2 protein n=1 Tax=Pseudomonas sp. PI1 TaxID=1582493 RepID=UPI00068BE524|nr:glycosyltransferase [Pseudomonas sp. PI1]KWR72754.1 rhamnosyltransferase [Pseudomonas sp. PI1]